MKTIFVAAVAGAVLAFGVALFVTRDVPAPVQPVANEARVAAPPAELTPARVPPPAPAVAAPADTAVEPEPDATPARPEQPADLSQRLRALEPLRQEVFASLAALEWRVAPCGVPNHGISLTLETLDGSVRIVEARVAPPPPRPDADEPADDPAASDHASTCVRSALQGVVVSAHAAKPGRRWEMLWWPGASS